MQKNLKESGDRFFMKRTGRAQQGLRKKRGGRGREGRTKYVTHILKISCGGEVFAKEFKEKVVIVFFQRRGRAQEGRERERGENQLYDTHPQNLLWSGFCKRI